MAPPLGRSPFLAYYKPALSIAVADQCPQFADTARKQFGLSVWPGIFEYVEHAVASQEAVDQATFSRIEHTNTRKETPHKWIRLDPLGPPAMHEWGSAKGDEWLRSWYVQFCSHAELTGKELGRLDAAVFQIQSSLGKAGQADGSGVATVWEGIRAAQAAASKALEQAGSWGCMEGLELKSLETAVQTAVGKARNARLQAAMAQSTATRVNQRCTQLEVAG